MTSPRLRAARAAARERADRIRSQLALAERREQRRHDLTPAQKRRNIQHLRQQAERQLRSERERYLESLPAMLTRMVRPVYKLPATTARDLSWRDAYARASAIRDQDEAVKAWQVARLVNDEIMLTALALVAAPNPVEEAPRWPAIIGLWRQSDPGIAEVLDEFDALAADLADPNERLADSQVFALPPPAELPEPSDELPTLADASQPAQQGAASDGQQG